MRLTAVFTIQFFRSIGFGVNNDLFAEIHGVSAICCLEKAMSFSTPLILLSKKVLSLCYTLTSSGIIAKSIC